MHKDREKMREFMIQFPIIQKKDPFLSQRAF
jgi:hypothetical protein